jgi:mannosyl-3-phosphoglycerate phosphatase
LADLFSIIFTDLDGTLLDHHTYSWQAAQPAIDLCHRQGVPIILNSSKTRAELVVLQEKLSISDPFISENGGGVFFSENRVKEPPTGSILDGGYWKWGLGASYETLVQGLKELRTLLGWPMIGFSDMSIEEISKCTNLDLKASRLAAMREFDEPFIIPDNASVDVEALMNAARDKGFRVTPGGRFYHLHGNNDKGQALEKLRGWYEEKHHELYTIALGDSPNDFPMLQKANCAVLVRSDRRFPDLKNRFPDLRVTKEIGPSGWNTAVINILGECGEENHV